MNENIINALYCMKESAELTVCEECSEYMRCDHTLQKHYAEMAVAALEKQIQKKPIKNRMQNIRYTSAYSCPCCGGSFTGTGIANYCYHCGQKLDWDN